MTDRDKKLNDFMAEMRHALHNSSPAYIAELTRILRDANSVAARPESQSYSHWGIH